VPAAHREYVIHYIKAVSQKVANKQNVCESQTCQRDTASLSRHIHSFLITFSPFSKRFISSLIPVVCSFKGASNYTSLSFGVSKRMCISISGENVSYSWPHKRHIQYIDPQIKQETMVEGLLVNWPSSRSSSYLGPSKLPQNTCMAEYLNFSLTLCLKRLYKEFVSSLHLLLKFLLLSMFQRLLSNVQTTSRIFVKAWSDDVSPLTHKYT
jgi:hypothetical protein